MSLQLQRSSRRTMSNSTTKKVKQTVNEMLSHQQQNSRSQGLLRADSGASGLRPVTEAKDATTESPSAELTASSPGLNNEVPNTPSSPSHTRNVTSGREAPDLTTEQSRNVPPSPLETTALTETFANLATQAPSAATEFRGHVFSGQGIQTIHPPRRRKYPLKQRPVRGPSNSHWKSPFRKNYKVEASGGQPGSCSNPKMFAWRCCGPGKSSEPFRFSAGIRFFANTEEVMFQNTSSSYANLASKPNRRENFENPLRFSERENNIRMSDELSDSCSEIHTTFVVDVSHVKANATPENVHHVNPASSDEFGGASANLCEACLQRRLEVTGSQSTLNHGSDFEGLDGFNASRENILAGCKSKSTGCCTIL